MASILDETGIDPQDAHFQNLLKDLQGNILKGHGRDYSINLFFAFKAGKQPQAREWLASFSANFVQSAAQQWIETRRFKDTGLPGNLFVNVLLTYNGYKALGIDDPKIPGPGDATDPFRNKMQGSGVTLADPAPSEWEAGLNNDFHVMILIADDSPYLVRSFKRAVIKSLDGIATIQKEQAGRVIRNEAGNGIEHNGYADGVSQPLYFKDDIADDATNVDGPQNDHTIWNPSAPLGLVLVKDDGGKFPDSFGSYMVFRKLEQNVKHFKDLESNLADQLHLSPANRERAGAMVVGRFEDGTPLTKFGAEEDLEKNKIPNAFRYTDDHGPGPRCPFQGHIRKANPRDDFASQAPAAVVPPTSDGRIAENNKHRITRRGIPYEDVPRPRKNGIIDDNFHPTGKVGLLFMCFQASLTNQFEFMQSAWVNNPEFAPAGTGIDPIIGQHAKLVAPGQQKWTDGYDPANPFSPPNQPLSFGFADTVKMLGGGYFFAPSLSFLTGLKPGAGLFGDLDLYTQLDAFLKP